ncbi:M56 family metallopeptidase [uncultured Gimesia sp.]|uniref:M56 family metallopeptidase n=1 Tax=uncultured Gimesia sp. TaxID=1678688 RepID=UPI0030DCF040|tara:strand:- start:217619 stop:221860 length:4242 start_codon:yes stop_codon:yes gene_type:complete
MIWQTFIDPTFSTRLCLTLLHSVWQFAVLAIVVWCLKLIWKNQTVERRYTVNVFALLLAIAALPVTFLVIKSTEDSGKPVIQAQSTATAVNSPSEPRMTTPDQPTSVVPVEIQTVEPPIESAENNTANHTSLDADAPGATFRGWLQITPWIMAIYVLGVGFMLARLIVSMIKVNRLSAQATVIKEGPLVESLRSLAKQWSMKMVPVLAEAEHIVVPTVVGLIRPLILLPASVVSGLTPDELELILAHELAHVRRYDMWVNLLQRLAEAVLFFNPALWYLSRQISGLREFCCDDLTCHAEAASDFERKVRYATALLRVVELSKPNLAANPELTSLAANGHSPSEVRRRVARLFDEPLREPLRLTRGMTYAVLALLLIGGPAAWSTYAENQSPAKTVQQENEAPTDAESTKPYSLDGNVEVLSIGTYEETPQRWWDVQGTLQSSSPYRVHGASIPVNEKQIGRQLVFRVNHLPQDATLSWTVSSKGSGATASVALNGEERAKEYYSQVFSANQDLKSVDLRLGVASGKWTTKLKMDADSITGFTLVDHTRSKQGVYHAMISGPFSQNEDIVVIGSHDIQDREIRIVAIDRQGELLRPHTAATNSIRSATFVQYKASFKDLKLKELDRFEFQTRPIEYIEIKNLPLNPQAKQKTAENNTTATDSPASVENAVVSGRIVLEDGSPATTTGYLYYKSKSRQSTVGQFVDQFSTKSPPGTIWLRYFPEGYSPVLVGPLKIKLGEQRDDIRIVLKPGFSHLLRMQNQKEELISGATVVVHPAWNGNVQGPVQKQMVNAKGELLLEHLADTNYSIKVTAPGYEPFHARSQDLRSQKKTTLTLTPSQKTTGVVQDTAGKPLANARLFLKHEITNEGRSLVYAGSKNGFWGELIATTDEQGRFGLDQLTKDSHYLCIVEAENGARAIIHDLQAGQHTSIVVSERRDLIVNISGDLSKLPQRRGKPFVSVRQGVDFHPIPDSRFGEQIGADTPVEVTDDGATAIFRGLAVDLKAGNEKQQVGVSLNYPNGPKKIVDIDPNQETRVQFDLTQLPDSENKGKSPASKIQQTTRKPDAQIKGKTNADASIPVKQPPTAKLSFVIAKHVILLEGKEIITWEEIDDLFKTLPDTSLISPAFYFTRGTMLSDGYQPAKAKMWELTRKYKFAGHSEGSLWPRTDFRYDQIKTATDLKPDPQSKMTGTIVDQKGTPIEGAEVALILPVDESIGYKTYHVALVLGRIRNRLEHVMTLSNASGQFDLYPPQDQKYYILAMHPEAGFALVRSDRLQADQNIKLLPWAGLKTELGNVPNEKQTVDLSNHIEAHEGWPEMMFNQYWDDLPQEVKEKGFIYNQIPPIYQANINRSFPEPDGGGISVPGASVSLFPGEKRELDLGPLSEQQRALLESMRNRSRERQRKFEEQRKNKAKN